MAYFEVSRTDGYVFFYITQKPAVELGFCLYKISNKRDSNLLGL